MPWRHLFHFFTEEIRLHDVILRFLRSNLPTPGLQIFSQQELFRYSVQLLCSADAGDLRAEKTV